MKRRIFVLPLVAISLLTSCSKIPDLRSDIAKFITSFSDDEARKVYLEAGYTRTDVSHEKSGEIITVGQQMSINVKDEENLVYDYRYEKTSSLGGTETKHYYIEKEEDYYMYYATGSQPQRKSAYEVKVELISKFFYEQEFEGTHVRGMYLGDYMLEVLPYIQNHVTIDEDKEELIYDMPLGEEKDAKGYEFSELLIVDKLGMTVSCDIYQTNGLTSLETTLRVYNNI